MIKKTIYTLDTEFIEDGKTIDLISLGLVCEDGRTLYLQNAECNFSKASDWVWRNVYPHLSHFNLKGQRGCSRTHRTYDSGLGHDYDSWCNKKIDDPCPWRTRREILDAVMAFCACEGDDKPEFWGYYADYDWVAFCQLFGTMMELPKGYPMYCRDLKQVADHFQFILPQPEVDVHHALVDAELAMGWYKMLIIDKSGTTHSSNRPV